MKKAILTNARAQFSIERTYAATMDEVWNLWTTKAGIESWWGPEGFDVTVPSINLKSGGELVYLMTATGPQQVKFMNLHGMSLSTVCKVSYVEVSPPYRLTYKTLTDFVPDVPPYEVSTVVEFQATAAGLKITITSEAMHDQAWTERARAGYESQLRKLDALMAAQGKTVRA